MLPAPEGLTGVSFEGPPAIPSQGSLASLGMWGGSCEDSDLELEPRFSLSSPLGPPTPGVVRRVSFIGCHLAVSGVTPLATLGQFLEQVLCRWSVHLSIRYEWAGMSSAGVARPSRPQLGL